MNERIKLLAEEAGIVFWEMSGDVDWRQANREHLDKFAQLILKDCIQYLTTEAERLYSLRNDDGDLCAEKCYDNIQGLRDHFGVEE